MNIHEYLKERGFEMTGEYREARYGDYYLGTVSERPEKWEYIPPSGRNRLILKKLRQTYEFDGQTFEVPEGYVFERIGLVRPGDLGKYLLEVPGSNYPPTEITSAAFEWCKYVYVILRKEN